MNKERGFTLIEVLIALAVVAIALTALLKATSQDITYTNRIKEKTLGHWVAMQGITMIQLGLLPLQPNQETTQITTIFGEKWYWRAKLLTMRDSKMQKIIVSLSKSASGPYGAPLIGYRYLNDA